MIRFLFEKAGKGNKLPILIYHQVVLESDFRRKFDPTIVEFDQQMAWIKRFFNPVNLVDGIKAAKQGELPERAIAITFDDGYANNYTSALPILQKHNIPATFFIASDFLDGGIMWNDAVLEAFMRAHGGLDFQHIGLGRFAPATGEERLSQAQKLLGKLKYLPFDERASLVQEITRSRNLPDDLMMTSEQLRSLAESGMEIGGHTLSHPILTRVTLEEAARQICENKTTLEQITQSTLRSFAYPNGKPDADYNLDITQIVKDAGYEIAVSTSPGVFSPSGSSYEIPRYTPWRRNFSGFVSQLWKNYRTPPTYCATEQSEQTNSVTN